MNSTSKQDIDFNKRISTFWDENRWEETPPYWAGFQPVQDHLAALAGNRSNHYHETLLMKHCSGRQFKNGISIACGLGRAERTFAQLGMVRSITGIDISPVSIQ